MTYTGTSETNFDGIALLLAIGAFAWLHIIYHDIKGKDQEGSSHNTIDCPVVFL